MRQNLGPLGQLFPQGTTITVGDVPLIEAGLSYQQIQAALADRARGIQSLMYAGNQVGTSPQDVLSRELAGGMATGAIGPFSPQQEAAGREAIISRGRQDLQGTMRNAEADFARRNIGGAAPAMQMAGLEQAGRASTSAQLGDYAMQMAAAQQAARQAGLASMTQQNMFEESMRNDLLNAIANAYLDTERGPIDLSGLLEIPETRGREIGTGSKVYKT